MAGRAPCPAGLRAWSLVLAAGLAAAAWAADPAPAATPDAPAPAEAAKPADPADLGRGLRYVRLEASEIELAAARAAPALVLDLRLASAETNSAARLGALLAHRDAARPVLLLLGSATPAPLRAAIPAAAPGVLTLAAKDSGLDASVLVAVDPACDRAAAAALAAGRPPRELIEEKLEKVRHDEASLAHNHAAGRSDGDSAAPSPAPEAAKTAAGPGPAPLHDVLLQRAVQLHRALLALDRIPEHT